MNDNPIFQFSHQLVGELMKGTNLVIQEFFRRNGIPVPSEAEIQRDPEAFQAKYASMCLLVTNTNQPFGGDEPDVFYEAWVCDRRNGKTSMARTFPFVRIRINNANTPQLEYVVEVCDDPEGAVQKMADNRDGESARGPEETPSNIVSLRSARNRAKARRKRTRA